MSISNLSTPNIITGYIGTLTADNITVTTSAIIPNITITGDLNTIGKIKCTNVEHDSISTSGGLEVTEDIKCKNITISNTLTAQTISYEQTEVIQSTDDSNGLNSGASQCKGGASINRSLYVGYPVHCLSTVDSTGKNDLNSSLVVSGGASVSSKIYCDSVNGNVYTDSITAPSNNLQIHSTNTTLTNVSCSTINTTGGTASNDYQHGDIVITGGLGVTNNINTLGNITTLGVLGGKTLNITNDGGITGTLTTKAINLIDGGSTGAISTTQYGDVVLTASVPDNSYIILNGYKTEVNGLLVANKLVNKSGLTTTVESDGASGAVVLSAVGVGAKVQTLVNDSNLTTNVAEDISKTRHNIYLTENSTNTADGSLHLEGGMSVIGNLHCGGSISGTSQTISGVSNLYDTVQMLGSNKFIRLASSNEPTYGSSIIEKNNNDLQIRNNGRSNGDYNAISSGQSVIDLNSNIVSIATSAPTVTPAVNRLTITDTKIDILPTTASTTISDGALVCAGGAGFNGKVNCLDVGVPNSSSVNTFVDTTNKKLSTIISLKSYAVGDGVYDDTAGVIAWITALSAVGAKYAGYIPYGIYKCTSTITWDLVNIATANSILVYGDGVTNSILKFTSGNQLIINNTGGTNVNGLVFRDFSVDGNYNGILMDVQANLQSSMLKCIRIRNISTLANAAGIQFNFFISSYLVDIWVSCGGSATGAFAMLIKNSSSSTYNGVRCSLSNLGIQLGINGTTIVFNGSTFNSLNTDACTTSLVIPDVHVTSNIFNCPDFGSSTTYSINATAGSNNIFIAPILSPIQSSTGCIIYGNPATTTGTLTVPNLNVGLTGQTLGINFNGIGGSSLNYYEVFSESKVFSTGSSTANVACSYVRIGKSVTMTLTQATVANSNSSFSCVSCIPTRFLAGTGSQQPIICTQTNNVTQGTIIITSGGNVTCWRDINSNFPNNSAVCVIGFSTVVHYQTA